jgi:hypothetical protein
VIRVRGAGRNGKQELVIDFSLPDLPPGECRQPYDDEWRRQFLPEDPEEYAAELADEVHHWATAHVEKFRPPPPGESAERRWERLVEHLDSGAPARALGHVRIEVTVDDRVVTIVMTPREWDDIASVAIGDSDAAAAQVTTWIRELPADQPFLVYTAYELEGSATAELPPDPDEPDLAVIARLREQADRAAIKFGWYAEPREGTRDWLADHEDD